MTSTALLCRVVESRFKRWLKQQGGAEAVKQAGAAEVDDAESGSEEGDNAALTAAQASAGNDTKKVAGHFPGWPVGSRCTLSEPQAHASGALQPLHVCCLVMRPATASHAPHSRIHSCACLPAACPSAAGALTRRIAPRRAYSRAELACLGFHFPPIAGIDFVQAGKAGKDAPSVRAGSARSLSVHGRGAALAPLFTA